MKPIKISPLAIATLLALACQVMASAPRMVDWIGSYDDDSSPWKVIVNEDKPPVFGYKPKKEGSLEIASSISPANWLPHQGWFVLIQDDTHLWAFDGLRKLLLYVISPRKGDCLYEFSTKPPFNTLPYRPPDEVLNHLPQEYRSKIEESCKKPKTHQMQRMQRAMRNPPLIP